VSTAGSAGWCARPASDPRSPWSGPPRSRCHAASHSLRSTA